MHPYTKGVKKTELDSLFALLGSAQVKSVRKMLIKLTLRGTERFTDLGKLNLLIVV